MIDVGLVGFGLAGKTFHAPIISAVDGLRLAAIVQRSGSDAVKTYPDATILRSVPELLARETIRLVVVATPNSTHYEIARAALVARRHVVVDKPLTPTWKEGDALANLAREKRVLLSIYQNRRWDGDFLTVRKLIESWGNWSTLNRISTAIALSCGQQRGVRGMNPAVACSSIWEHISSTRQLCCSDRRRRSELTCAPSGLEPQLTTLSK